MLSVQLSPGEDKMETMAPAVYFSLGLTILFLTNNFARGWIKRLIDEEDVDIDDDLPGWAVVQASNMAVIAILILGTIFWPAVIIGEVCRRFWAPFPAKPENNDQPR
ncbi:MAG: hypothetical protein WCT40_04025 [Candidatus Magasanikbacteria bacterium]